jgi:hypothetical protein
MRRIQIDDRIQRFLVARAVDLGAEPSSILRRELALDDGGPRPPSLVEFRIPAGTAGRAWNTADTSVVAMVGDTLRIVNADAVAHRLHTTGVPFPHPEGDILPGQSTDFLLAAAFDPPGTSALQDHAVGPDARFFLRVRAAR